jgi:hypothetical protein
VSSASNTYGRTPTPVGGSVSQPAADHGRQHGITVIDGDARACSTRPRTSGKRRCGHDRWDAIVGRSQGHDPGRRSLVAIGLVRSEGSRSQKHSYARTYVRATPSSPHRPRYTSAASGGRSSAEAAVTRIDVAAQRLERQCHGRRRRDRSVLAAPRASVSARPTVEPSRLHALPAMRRADAGSAE